MVLERGEGDECLTWGMGIGLGGEWNRGENVSW